jgi:hypothetical protein
MGKGLGEGERWTSVILTSVLPPLKHGGQKRSPSLLLPGVRPPSSPFLQAISAGPRRDQGFS